jgi:hypothetical protein
MLSLERAPDGRWQAYRLSTRGREWLCLSLRCWSPFPQFSTIWESHFEAIRDTLELDSTLIG